MSILLDHLISSASRITVLHSVPGRIRVHIPHLTRIMDLLGGILDLDQLPDTFPAVHSVDFSLVTGNAVISYDESVISEAQILKSMRTLFRQLVRHRRTLQELASQDPRVLEQKIQLFLDLLGQKILDTEKDIELPDDFWTKKT